MIPGSGPNRENPGGRGFKSHRPHQFSLFSHAGANLLGNFSPVWGSYSERFQPLLSVNEQMVRIVVSAQAYDGRGKVEERMLIASHTSNSQSFPPFAFSVRVDVDVADDAAPAIRYHSMACGTLAPWKPYRFPCLHLIS